MLNSTKDILTLKELQGIRQTTQRLEKERKKC